MADDRGHQGDQDRGAASQAQAGRGRPPGDGQASAAGWACQGRGRRLALDAGDRKEVCRERRRRHERQAVRHGLAAGRGRPRGHRRGEVRAGVGRRGRPDGAQQDGRARAARADQRLRLLVRWEWGARGGPAQAGCACGPGKREVLLRACALAGALRGAKALLGLRHELAALAGELEEGVVRLALERRVAWVRVGARPAAAREPWAPQGAEAAGSQKSSQAAVAPRRRAAWAVARQERGPAGQARPVSRRKPVAEAEQQAWVGRQAAEARRAPRPG